MKAIQSIALLLLTSLSCSYSNIDSLKTVETKFEWTPVAAYDSDIGAGVGLKGFYLNPIGEGESFDMLGFASYNGERWINFRFAIPDFELRQGKVYDWALDLVIDYDLMIKNSYFGVGNNSSLDDRILYAKEPTDISLVISRALTGEFVAGSGVRFRSVNNYDIEKKEIYSEGYHEIDMGAINIFSYFFNIRYDSRDSFINPGQGIVAAASFENAPDFSLNDIGYTRYAMELSYYYTINVLNSVLAARFKAEWYPNDNLPVQALLPIGGNRTLRGAPQDRYLDNATGIFNLELRYSIIGRLGGIIALDAGRVWNAIQKFSFRDFHTAPAFGLRYYMDTFVLRADLGLTSESACIYLNFGHIF